jgi:hypothetical protein
LEVLSNFENQSDRSLLPPGSSGDGSNGRDIREMEALATPGVKKTRLLQGSAKD